jgi:hypothetical protein
MAKSKKHESDERPRTESLSGSGENAEGAPPQLSGDTTAANVDRERLAARAYELYLERGGGEGKELEDWLTAEGEFQRGEARRGGTDES